MPRKPVQQSVTTERGDERHPAWVFISAHRILATPGVPLFDSDVQHREFIEIKLEKVERKRELNRDWLFPYKTIFTVRLSLAQWASFVSSMGTSGVPATLDFVLGEEVPAVPYEPRLAASLQETHNAAEKAFGKIKEAFQKYEELMATRPGIKVQRDAMRGLKSVIQSATPNVDFAAKSFVELTENVVQRARADVEAMVTNHAATLGVEVPKDFLALPEATSTSSGYMDHESGEDS